MSIVSFTASFVLDYYFCSLILFLPTGGICKFSYDSVGSCNTESKGEGQLGCVRQNQEKGEGEAEPER